MLSAEDLRASQMIKQLELLEEKERLENSLHAYIKKSWDVIEPFTTYIDNWHIEAIAEHLEAVRLGQINRLLINIPPRYMKSIAVTVAFPTWVWCTEPHKRFISLSYSATLSKKHNINRRDIIKSPWYQGLWSDRFVLKTDMDTQMKFENDKMGFMFATSIGGTLTGEGGDCFPKGTIIKTEIGDVDIEDLYLMETLPRVLSYNHKCGRLEYKAIAATRRKYSDDIIEVETFSGRKILSTREHRYYVSEQGYRKGYNLRPGDKLINCEVEVKQELHDMREGKERKGHNVQRLLQDSKKERRCFDMRELQKSFREKNVRIQKSIKERIRNILLLNWMQKRTSSNNEQVALPSLQQSKAEGKRLLLGRVQERIIDTKERRENREETNSVRWMRRFICSIRENKHILFEGLRKLGTLGKNEREKQFQLQGREKLCEAIQRDEVVNNRKRRGTVFSLQKRKVDKHRRVEREKDTEDKFSCSSHRQKCKELRIRKLDNTMPRLSYKASQNERDYDYVRSVKSVGAGKIPVYDIQVEGNNNFFANEILVHNCILVDDPHNPQQAHSDAERESALEFFRTTLPTRLNNKKTGAIIVVMQRLHELDISGHCLKDGGYTHLCLPGIAEKRQVISFPISLKEIIRNEGDCLWPEREDRTELDAMKKALGSYGFSGQYQQNPSPAEGGMVKRHWIRYWKPKDMELPPVRVKTGDNYIEVKAIDKPSEFDMQLQSWDLNFKESEDCDPVGCHIYANKGANIFLLDRVNKHIGFTDTVKEIEHITHKWPHASIKLIEDKANGPAVIDVLQYKIGGIMPIKPEGSKLARLSAVTPWMESGNYYLPHPDLYPWVEEVIDQLTKFPKAEHDEDVDCCSQGLYRFIYASNDYVATKHVDDDDEDERRSGGGYFD